VINWEISPIITFKLCQTGHLMLQLITVSGENTYDCVQAQRWMKYLIFKDKIIRLFLITNQKTALKRSLDSVSPFLISVLLRIYPSLQHLNNNTSLSFQQINKFNNKSLKFYSWFLQQISVLSNSRKHLSLSRSN
jgi:hypothetical protein